MEVNGPTQPTVMRMFVLSRESNLDEYEYAKTSEDAGRRRHEPDEQFVKSVVGLLLGWRKEAPVAGSEFFVFECGVMHVVEGIRHL